MSTQQELMDEFLKDIHERDKEEKKRRNQDLWNQMLEDMFKLKDDILSGSTSIPSLKEEISKCVNKERHLVDKHGNEDVISDSDILDELVLILKKHNLY